MENEKEKAIYDQAKKIVNDIIDFSENLPQSNFRKISERLKFTVNNMPETLYDGLLKERKIDHIRALIQADTALAECKDQLSLVEMLRYADTKTLLKEINDFSDLLTRNCKIS